MNATNSSALKGNLKTLLATGGVFAGGNLLSQAAIIFTDNPDLTYSGSELIYFSLSSGVAQLDGLGGDNLQFVLGSGGTQTPMAIRAFLDSTVASIAYFGGNYAFKLSGGALIDSALTFRADTLMAQYAAGEWDPDGTHGYLGLRFNEGAGDRFGWAEVSYNANESVTLYGFAYEDSGGQIVTPVPEPATTGAIAAVLAGSVAAFEARRRRKVAKQAAVQQEPIAV